MIENKQPQPVLVTHGLTVHYDNRPAIHDIDLAIYPGQTTSLLGPNGSGKSTLLKTLGGMLPASHGSVSFQGHPLNRPHPQITYVPQRSGADWTFPISVLECVLLGVRHPRPRWKPFDRKEKEMALEALRQTGMHNLAHVQIGALSGGQQQRVFLARALLACGSVLLLDEPFTGVDVPTQELLVDLIDQLRQDGSAIVYATHDLAQAAATSNRVVLLNREIIASGAPAEVLDEARLRATFGGSVIVVPGARTTPTPEPAVG
jgi:ABC-type Mn2+/Zn2+ transport system ATPase subunit